MAAVRAYNAAAEFLAAASELWRIISRRPPAGRAFEMR